jgi:hypothetical protein
MAGEEKSVNQRPVMKGITQTVGRLKILKKQVLSVILYSSAERRHSMVVPAALWKVKRDFHLGIFSLIHLKDDILYDCLHFVRTHLKSDGHFYANINTDAKPDVRWQGFPVVHRSLKFYEQACASNGLNLRDIGRLRDLGHVTGAASGMDNQCSRSGRLRDSNDLFRRGPRAHP